MSHTLFEEIFFGYAVKRNAEPESAGYYWAYAEGLTSEPWMVYYNPDYGSKNEVWMFGGGSRPISDFTHYSGKVEQPKKIFTKADASETTQSANAEASATKEVL